MGTYEALHFISPSKSVAALHLMKREVDQMDLGFFLPLFCFFYYYYFFLSLFCKGRSLRKEHSQKNLLVKAHYIFQAQKKCHFKRKPSYSETFVALLQCM